MKVAIVGAGAIGGFLAVRLSLAGMEVSVVDQGAHLRAIHASGLRLLNSEGDTLAAKDLRVCDSVSDVGAQDVVLLGVKAHQISAIATVLGKELGPETMVVTLQNGIPWWYFQRAAGPWAGRTLSRLDPDGAIARHIPIEAVVGCVAYPACTVQSPGVIRHQEGNRFPVGELDGRRTPRIERLSAMFQKAGFKSPILEDIRSEIWLKLWGNLSFNPVSALTHATLVDICRFPASRELVASMMREAEAVAERLGISFRVTLERRIAGAEAVGRHKTSMLQDVEAGRPLELEALLGAVAELGELTGTPTPTISAIFACVGLLGETLNRQGGRLRVEAREDDDAAGGQEMARRRSFKSAEGEYATE